MDEIDAEASGSSRPSDIAWKVEASKPLLETAIFSLREEESRGPEGRRGHFIVMDAPEWAMVVPELEGGRFLMVRQWRHGSAEESLEFPGGVIERGEDCGAGILRELEEETGYRAKQIDYLGWAYPNPAFQRNRCHVFRARGLDLAHGQDLDSNEAIRVEIHGANEVIAGVGTPPLSHALMILALYYWQRAGGFQAP
jgi:ADP-ribose pyrophosphatase